MATYKDIYRDLKNGYSFSNGYRYLYIDTCERYGSPSYGKDYIYWGNYGASAESVSYKNLCFVLSVIFGMRANEFYKTFKME